MEKDALCATKDTCLLEDIRFRQRCFLIQFRERSQLCFGFKVAYSDGLVSRLVKDRKNRTPVGIVVKGWLILGKEAPEVMTWYDGTRYCANIKVSGKGCQLCPEDLRYFLVKYDGEINSLLCDLGFEPFDNNEFYFCQETAGNYRDEAEVFCQSKGWNYRTAKSNARRVRPMVRLFQE